MVKNEKKLAKLIDKIKNLKDFDGETTQYMLEQLGMEGQMLRQLMMTSQADYVHELYDERFGSNSKEAEHRMKMIMDDVNEIRIFIVEKLPEIMEGDVPTRQCEDIFTHFTNIAIASDLDNTDCLSWKLFSQENKTIDEKLMEFYTELEKQEEYFECDDMSGTCHVVCSGSDKDYCCTPFWENDEDIQIQVGIDGNPILDYTIKCKCPTNDIELEEFKIFYISIVKELISNMVVK